MRGAAALYTKFGAIVMLPLTALMGCGADGLADQIARDRAKAVIHPVLAERFPGIPLAPAVNCVIEEASAEELGQLARVASEPSTLDVSLVLDIASRPDASTCLVNTTVQLAASAARRT